MAVEKLSSIQKERIQRLEPALKIAVANGDLKLIKSIIADLQTIYLTTGNEARLLMAKNRWLEAEMDHGNYKTAESGLLGIRSKAKKTTRVYLEATTILAICYLRLNDIEKAEPFMREVLINNNVIKSEEKRIEFRRLAIERFDEEAILFAIKSERIKDVLDDVNEIELEAVNLSTKNTADQLFENLGMQIPNGAKNILIRVDSFAKKQLPSAEKLRLPSPILSQENKKVGRTVFSSVKKVLYKSLCEKEGDLNKKIKAGILSIKVSLVATITELFTNLNIGIRVMAVGIIAIILRLGVDVYCDRYKPIDIMDLR